MSDSIVLLSAQLALKKERRLLILLSAIQFTHVLDFVIMMPLGPQFMRTFDIGPGTFGVLVSAYTFSAGISGFISAFWIDQMDRKKALLGLYFGFFLATLACAFSFSLGSFIGARILSGLFGGVMSSSVFSILGDVIPESRRGRAMGIVMSSFSLASVAGVPLGLLLANQWNWHATFGFLSVASLFVWVAGFWLIPSMRGHLEKRNPWAQVKGVLSVPNHLLVFAFIAVMMLAGFTVIPFIAPYMVFNGKMSEAELKYMYLFGGLFTFFSSQWIGRISDRLGKKTVFIRVASLSLVPILWLTHMEQQPFWILIVSSTAFMVLVSGRFVPAMAMTTSSVGLKYRGAFMSINGSVQQVSSGVSSLFGGWMLSKSSDGKIENFGLLGWVAAFFTLVAIWIATKINQATD
jgi:predicted MFS family arabinose efflux permease